MDDRGINNQKEISSVEIINKTIISRATLNNYIKMGLLPRPFVRRPGDTTVSRAKQMGYFPVSVLGRLDKIKQYKQEGRRMGEVCKLLMETPIPSSAENRIIQTNDAGTLSLNRNVSDYRNETEELFSFEETHPGRLSANRETKRDIRITLKQNAVNLLHFSILVAKIQGSTKMKAELPPDVYIALIRQIFKSVTLIFKQRFGVYGKYPGDGAVFYFLKDCDPSYLMNAVVCALELKQMMKRVSHEWKMKSEHFDELFLNIGLAEGHEYLGTISASSAAEYISLGDSINAARRLSDLASSGAIWATKNLLNFLEEKDRRQIRYGIYRRAKNREVWVEKIFSRIIDLIPQDDPMYSKYIDIRFLPVTEIQALG